jgi:hypothetical protein
MTNEIKTTYTHISKLESLLADLNSCSNYSMEIKLIKEQIIKLNSLYLTMNEQIDTIESAFSKK